MRHPRCTNAADATTSRKPAKARTGERRAARGGVLSRPDEHSTVKNTVRLKLRCEVKLDLGEVFLGESQGVAGVG